MDMIDLRSDTVTRPTPAMREVMAAAEVGDDVYGEDPTVRRLEERAADLLGTEAALFVPSGTMGNQTAIACHTRPGQEVIVEEGSHIYNVELATMARFSGVQPRVLPGERGVFTARQVAAAIRPDIYYLAPTGLVCLENTHNAAGGRIWPLAAAREVLDLAHGRGIPVHLDGARILNASVATGIPARELALGFDSVMFCLSKGLGCPVGSLLCGSREFIAAARRTRKALGGGMRQAGILAAAGLYALDHHVDRLAQDHVHARLLADGLASLPALSVWPPDTNIVIFEIARGPDAEALCQRLRDRGVLASPAGAGTSARQVRMVTHLGISAADVQRTVDLVGRELGTARA
ncbi:MAG: low-specificity L-threonine aldolase [Candidatus Bipolaricaulis anaerobius]|nr:low-specificity L-threonine aldolase [Candidatus Bipolaricaulis sp.]MDD5764476.1 low-specificity L-threonine aldolase [Candidatus Bipolaricaulis anaerobius]